jgi:hypothetical protein
MLKEKLLESVIWREWSRFELTGMEATSGDISLKTKRGKDDSI